MSYSIISTLAIILNLIINREAFKHYRIRSVGYEPEQRAAIRYCHFLLAANCYFIVDIAWGLLYEHHDIEKLFPFLYSDCILYFLLMFTTMLTLMRYIVAYLDKKWRKSKPLLHAVWSIFSLGLINLMINCFCPFIFSFNAEHEYITEPGRHIAFILQVALYVVTSTYMFHIAHKATRSERAQYIAVGLTCFVMEFFLILQIFDFRYPSYASGLIIGICVIHSFVESGEMKEKEIYDHIARSLAENYEAIYYINLETGEYLEFSASSEYASMNVHMEGRDFFAENPENIMKYVHPDDREFSLNLHRKETILKNLENRKSFSYKYRIMVNGQSRHFYFTMLRANDDKHIILCEKDIEDEFTAESMRLENQKKHVTFSQIAETLAVNYDVIYYVNAKDSSYTSFECRDIYGQLNMQKSGEDFFVDARKDIPQIVHKNDRELILEFINKDHIISALTDKKSCSIDYRILAFKKTHYARMTVRKTENDTHYIIAVENIDEEVQREKQHLKALNTEKELARRDELTGVKNKTSYNELEKSVQANIDNGMDYLPFGLVVCDTNDLKKINDTEGHAAGDEYIKKSAALLCNTFVHCPVFRVGGDEFVVFVRGSDYANRESLVESLRAQIRENLQSKSGPVLAFGIAEFIPKKDTLMSEVFDRADKEMYKNKRELKKEESQH